MLSARELLWEWRQGGMHGASWMLLLQNRAVPWPRCSDHELPGELWCGSEAAPPASKAHTSDMAHVLTLSLGVSPGHSCKGEVELPR